MVCYNNFHLVSILFLHIIMLLMICLSHHPGIVVEKKKKNHRNSSGDYVYELVVKGENGAN